METDIESRHSDIKYKYSFVSIFILLALLVLIFFSVSSYAASNPEIIIDSVNIGDSLDEAGHNLFGFGPIEPATHGGGWGGADDGNLRVIWFNDSANPSDVLTQSPDENYASAQLSIPTNYIPTKIEVRLLDGIADDSFEIYLNNDLVYTYSDQGSTETWETHEIDLSSMYLSGLVEIKIKSTAPNWTGFDTYGQLGVSWINLYAIEGEEVTVKLVDSKNNTLENGYVEYHRDGWKEFGTTDSAGEISKLVPKGKYTFRMTYYGACVSKRQDISVDPVVIFNTVKVSVKLQNSNGIPLSDGNASVHSGGWKVFGITDLNGKVTKELLPRTYTFKIIYDGAGVSLRQDVSVNSTIVFSTIKVTVMLQDSADLPLFGGNVSYHSGGWKHFGFTDVNGSVCGELLSRKYTFRMTYLGASISLRQDLSVDPVVIFNTVSVTVGLFDSSSNPLENNTVEVNSGGWKHFGITNESGTAKSEFLPRTYTFKVWYDGVNIYKKQDVSTDSFVIFNTIDVTVKLQDSTGSPISGGVIDYHSGGWKYLGVTDENGSVHAEFLPRTYTFKVTYDGASISLRQDINVDSVVVFSTIEVSVKLQSSNGSPLVGGNVSYHFGGWKHFGFTNASGLVTKELLPRTYTFKMSYDGTYVTKRQDVSSDSFVVFSTIKVTVMLQDSADLPLFGGNVSYHSGGWKHFGFTDVNGSVCGELLSSKYTFRMGYLDAFVSLRQDLSVDPIVVFSTTKVTVKLVNNSGIPIQGGNVSVHSGGWKFFGITDENGTSIKELLPRTYTFKVIYDGAGVSLRQDIRVNSTVVFSKIKVTVILQDNIGNLLSDGNISYYSAGWKFFGITDDNGSTINELLPRKFTFRATYNGKRYTLRQNVGEDSIVIIRTNTIENYPAVSNPNGPYSGYINQSINFNGSQSYDPDGTIVNYTWDFGDGNISYGVKVEHTYAQIGDYIVNLTVLDNEALSSYNTTHAKITIKQTNTVINKNHYAPSYSVVIYNHDSEENLEDPIENETLDEEINTPPVAKVVFNIGGDGEESISFDASQSCDPDGDDITYRWDFDNDGIWDTNYSRDPLFNYSYSDSCSQGQVRLEVSDGKSSDETTISYVLESHVDQSKEVCGQESSKKRYSLFIEWWVFFVFFIISLIFVLYIYKKRCFIINNIKSSCLIPKNKQKRIGKLVAIIFKLFY